MSDSTQAIARDLLIAAMEHKSIFPTGDDASARAADLGAAYRKLLLALDDADGELLQQRRAR